MSVSKGRRVSMMASVSTRRVHLHVTARRASQGLAVRQMWMSVSHTRARMMVRAWMIRAPFVASACQVSRHLSLLLFLYSLSFWCICNKSCKNASLGFTMFACMDVKIGGNPIFLWNFVLFGFKKFLSAEQFWVQLHNNSINFTVTLQ